MAAPCKLAAQSPPCDFTVSVSSSGLATVDLAASPGSWCKNAIDWGDGCINESTTDPATHQYVNCGNFTIKHTIYDASCNEAGICSEPLTVDIPAVSVTLSKMGFGGNCGVRWNLKTVLKKATGCQPATQPVTISGTIPDDLMIIGGGDFAVNGQAVTATVTAQEINTGTVTLDLSVIPKWCKYTAPVDPVQINLKASTAGMALSSTTQPNICIPNPNTNNLAVQLQWEFTPVPKCPDVVIEVQGCQRVSFGAVANLFRLWT